MMSQRQSLIHADSLSPHLANSQQGTQLHVSSQLGQDEAGAAWFGQSAVGRHQQNTAVFLFVLMQ